jgi:thiol-disulfide isomerase/thioredoxin
MTFLKKNWGNILFFAFIILLFIPQTGMPIRVFINRIIAFSPSEVDEEDVVVLEDYQWSLTSLDGDRVNLSNSEGKVILVNLWATWCPPCVAEMPSLQKLYNKYGEDVAFYFVSSESPDRLSAFLQKKGYDFPVYIEKQAPPKLLQSRSLPSTFVISKEGRIVIYKTGSADWNNTKVHDILDRLLQP